MSNAAPDEEAGIFPKAARDEGADVFVSKAAQDDIAEVERTLLKSARDEGAGRHFLKSARDEMAGDGAVVTNLSNAARDEGAVIFPKVAQDEGAGIFSKRSTR